jgi:transcriptional regulator GlxA family with amidase domain
MTRARKLLEFSQSTVDEVAATGSLDDATGSRRAFLKIVGLRRHREPFLTGIEESRHLWCGDIP